MYFREMAITYSIIKPNYPIVMGLCESDTVMHKSHPDNYMLFYTP